MTDYGKADECLFTIDKLYHLLEQHQEEVSTAIQGEIYEEYKKLVEQEMEKIQELKGIVVRYQYMYIILCNKGARKNAGRKETNR